MKAEERNRKIIEYFTEVMTRANETSEEIYEELPQYQEVKSALEVLIPHKYDGFRGVVMTAIGGMFLNPKYNPIDDFYACSPRPVFENGIYYVLERFQVPTGKSAPLNVAKGITKLNKAWVNGRKGNSQATAQACIDFLKILLDNKKDNNLYNSYIDYFFMRLEVFANSVRSIAVEVVDAETDSKLILAQKLISFTVSFPEAGTVPQMVIGKLLRFTIDKDNKHVKGEDESVFGTNTTSKKPADIWIEDNAGDTLNLYEITVKKVDYKRLDDSVHAINQLNDVDGEINFICRMPEDTKTLDFGTNENTIYYKGQWFNFINIKEFIISCIVLLSDNELKEYFLEMVSFIEEVNRPKLIKDGWNEIFSV